MGMQRVRQNKLRQKGFVYYLDDQKTIRSRIHKALVSSVMVEREKPEEDVDLSLNIKGKCKSSILRGTGREGVSAVGREKRKGKSKPPTHL